MLTLAPARMQQALSRVHTLCNPSRTCYLQEAENSKGHKTGSCSAAMAGCGAAGSTIPLGHSQAAAACLWRVWAAFWGAQPCLHPPAFPPKLSRGGGRVGAAWMFGRGAFVRRWQRVCLRLAAVPVQRGDYRAGEQQARLPPRSQHKSSSFQLTLSARQAARGIMPEFARGKKNEIRGDF